MKVYIASHSQELAKEVRDFVVNAGHEVISRWIDKPFNRTGTFTEQERTQIADENEHDIRNCDALVLISGNEKYSGGKFIEAGYARGLNKKVIIVGKRENMQTWAGKFFRCDSFYQLKGFLDMWG